MRWGVRDEMTNEHMTTELCMTELRNCQRLSMGPNFIYFGAQKYGYRPIPTYIVSSELAMLRDVLVTMGKTEFIREIVTSGTRLGCFHTKYFAFKGPLSHARKYLKKYFLSGKYFQLKRAHMRNIPWVSLMSGVWAQPKMSHLRHFRQG